MCSTIQFQLLHSIIGQCKGHQKGQLDGYDTQTCTIKQYDSSTSHSEKYKSALARECLANDKRVKFNEEFGALVLLETDGETETRFVSHGLITVLGRISEHNKHTNVTTCNNQDTDSSTTMVIFR